MAQLNRADAEKDAHEPPCVSKTTLFTTCANKLFGSPTVHYKELFQIVNAHIEKHSRIRSGAIYPKTRLSTLRHPLDAHVLFLPERVTYAVQDSGLSPDDFGKVVNLVTPASYIDSAPRSAPHQSTLLFGFDKVIPRQIFTKVLGISNIESLTCSLDKPSMSCSVSIVCTFDNRRRKLDVVFDKSLKPAHGDTVFFKGNPTKNDWFAKAAKQPRTTTELIDTGCSYILCKILGDSLLAYYGKAFEDTLPDGQNRVCVFTCDKVMASRCRLLQLPVVIKDYIAMEKELHECVYYPSPGIVDNDIQEMFCRFVVSHNESVIQTIHYAVHSRNILLNTHMVTIDPKLVLYVVSFIERMNRNVRDIDASSMTIPEYRHETSKYLANHLFTKTGVYYIVRTEETRICEGFPGLGRAKNIGELLQSMSGGGGSDDDMLLPPELYEAAFRDIPYADMRDPTDLMVDATYDVQLRRRIYLLLSTTTTQSDRVLQTEDIFNYLYSRFLIVGGILLEMTFLSEFVQMYARGDSLYDVGVREFERKYELWKTRHIDDSSSPPASAPPQQQSKTVRVHGGTRKQSKRRTQKTRSTPRIPRENHKDRKCGDT